MAYTSQGLIALERAIAPSERIVQFADRRVEYRDIGDLIRAPFSGSTWLTL